LAPIAIAACLGLCIFLLGLLGNDETRRSMGEKARKKVKERYSWESVAEIRLAAGEDSVRLYKQGGRWLVGTEGDYPADTTAIGGILDKAESFDQRYLRLRRCWKSHLNYRNRGGC